MDDSLYATALLLTNHFFGLLWSTPLPHCIYIYIYISLSLSLYLCPNPGPVATSIFLPAFHPTCLACLATSSEMAEYGRLKLPRPVQHIKVKQDTILPENLRAKAKVSRNFFQPGNSSSKATQFCFRSSHLFSRRSTSKKWRVEQVPVKKCKVDMTCEKGYQPMVQADIVMHIAIDNPQFEDVPCLLRSFVGRYFLGTTSEILTCLETPETHSFIFSGNRWRKKEAEIQSKFVLFRNLMVPVNMENIPGLTQKTKLVNQISEP